MCINISVWKTRRSITLHIVSSQYHPSIYVPLIQNSGENPPKITGELVSLGVEATTFEVRLWFNNFWSKIMIWKFCSLSDAWRHGLSCGACFRRIATKEGAGRAEHAVTCGPAPLDTWLDGDGTHAGLHPARVWTRGLVVSFQLAPCQRCPWSLFLGCPCTQAATHWLLLCYSVLVCFAMLQYKYDDQYMDDQGRNFAWSWALGLLMFVPQLCTPQRPLNALEVIATHRNTWQHDATHCNTPHHTATHCNALQHTAGKRRPSEALADIATKHNTTQHTATHCNTLQHTATHCNTF